MTFLLAHNVYTFPSTGISSVPVVNVNDVGRLKTERERSVDETSPAESHLLR